MIMIETVKKLVEYAIFPPGSIIIVFLVISLFSTKKKFVFYLSLFCAVVLYLASISPVKNMLVSPLEQSYKIPKNLHANAIVVLGAGSYNKNTLDGDSLNRLVGGYILYKKLHLPIIFSGGYATSTRSTANIAKKILEQMGVNSKDIFIDNKSFDTNQNAIYTAKICRKQNFRKIILVTSAYHMRRAVMLFKKHNLDVIPYPVDFKESHSYNFYSYLPTLGNLVISTEALREYLGYLYYKLIFFL